MFKVTFTSNLANSSNYWQWKNEQKSKNRTSVFLLDCPLYYVGEGWGSATKWCWTEGRYTLQCRCPPPPPPPHCYHSCCYLLRENVRNGRQGKSKKLWCRTRKKGIVEALLASVGMFKWTANGQATHKIPDTVSFRGNMRLYLEKWGSKWLWCGSVQ